ncbi:hypothetical protein T492DRAFT_844555 [Pavlovales sp. CCMP2436]|nr:hypothetical protein T492DRAFT_844555 [Pavlovales sp. CCMP2436]
MQSSPALTRTHTHTHARTRTHTHHSWGGKHLTSAMLARPNAPNKAAVPPTYTHTHTHTHASTRSHALITVQREGEHRTRAMLARPNAPNRAAVPPNASADPVNSPRPINAKVASVAVYRYMKGGGECIDGAVGGGFSDADAANSQRPIYQRKGGECRYLSIRGGGNQEQARESGEGFVGEEAGKAGKAGDHTQRRME